jgi:hypothetical protein
MDLEDADQFTIGQQATCNGRVFAVRSEPKRRDAGGIVQAADHAKVLLEQLNVTDAP